MQLIFILSSLNFRRYWNHNIVLNSSKEEEKFDSLSRDSNVCVNVCVCVVSSCISIQMIFGAISLCNDQKKACTYTELNPDLHPITMIQIRSERLIYSRHAGSQKTTYH